MRARDSWDILLDALRTAYQDGGEHPVVVCAVHRNDLPRLLGHVGRGKGRSEWTPGERFRRLNQLAEGPP